MCASKGNKSNNVGTTTPIITKMCAPFRNCTENSSSIGHWTKSVSKAANFPFYNVIIRYWCAILYTLQVKKKILVTIDRFWIFMGGGGVQ